MSANRGSNRRTDFRVIHVSEVFAETLLGESPQLVGHGDGVVDETRGALGQKCFIGIDAPAPFSASYGEDGDNGQGGVGGLARNDEDRAFYVFVATTKVLLNGNTVLPSSDG